MTSLIHRFIRGFVAPNYLVACNPTLWQEGIAELRRRGQNRRESGAFLLGTLKGGKRHVTRFVYYDDLDPRALDSGVITFNGIHFPKLWTICRETGLRVVADVHTHPRRAFLSPTDRDNPMLPREGHVAIVVPDYAWMTFQHQHVETYAVHQYLGDNNWRDYSGPGAQKFFYIGRWTSP